MNVCGCVLVWVWVCMCVCEHLAEDLDEKWIQWQSCSFLSLGLVLWLDGAAGIRAQMEVG